jgi:hypothetical protein
MRDNWNKNLREVICMQSEIFTRPGTDDVSP